MTEQKKPTNRELAVAQIQRSPTHWAMGLVSNFDKTYKGLMETESAQRCAMSAATKVMAFMNEQGLSWKEVDTQHLGRIIIRLAILGLDAESGDWYAYSRRNKKTGLQQFEQAPSYQGERKLRIKYSIGSFGKIVDIQALTIREGDVYKVNKDLFGKVKEVTYEPLPFNDGKIIGYIGIVLFENGEMIAKEYTPDKILEYKKANPNGGSPAWDKWPEEMAHAKVIRHTAKDFAFEIPNVTKQALSRLDEEDADEEADQLQGTQTIDITAEEVEEPEPEPEPKPEPKPKPKAKTPKPDAEMKATPEPKPEQGKKPEQRSFLDEIADDDFDL